MKRLITICAVVVLVVAATPAVADLTIGDEDGAYYTYQKWSFDTLTTQLGSQEWGPLFPEVDDNPYGESPDGLPPVASSLLTLGDVAAGTQNSIVAAIDSTGWYAELNGRFGVMHSAGEGGVILADLYIPNFEDLNMYKIVQIETVYQGTLIALYVDDGELISQVSHPEGEWTNTISTWSIDPQPASENIHLQWLGAASVDYIEVATVCVPVPGAVLLGMLGLGAVGIKLRKYA